MFVLVTCENLILILERGEGGWTIPGGKPEGNESPKSSAVRELAEEAGFWSDRRHLDTYELDPLGQYPESDLIELASGRFPMYLLQVDRTKMDVPSARMNKFDPNENSKVPEHVRYKWVSQEEFPNYMKREARFVLPLLNRYLNETKYSLMSRLL